MAEWIKYKYYPIDQGGHLIKKPHDMSVNTDNIVNIRQTDNDIGKNQCHMQVVGGPDYTLAESYTAAIAKL